MNLLHCFRTFLLLFLLSGNFCYSQDTLKIYFESGKSTIRPYYEKLLRHFTDRTDKENIRSISITGYADSIGKIKSNLKLSERRARAVQKSMRAYLGDSIDLEIGALGEKAQRADSVSRRVEIVVHSLSSTDDEHTAQLDSIKANDPRCFQVDFDALKYCNIRYIEKNRKQYVYIQALNVPLFKETKHYFVKNPGAKTALAQRVNWKLQTTGKLWWKKKRWVATIPKASYDRFQFFVIKNGPCEGCTESLFRKDTNLRTRVTKYPDYFLNDNVQVKPQLFKRNFEKFRVPREFIDPEETSYAYLFDDDNYQFRASEVVSWEEKKGKRKQDYYFAEIRTRGAATVRFMKAGLETYCPFVDTLHRAAYYGYWGIRCGTMNDWNERGKKPVSPALEAGMFYHNDSLTGFVALLGRYETGRSLISLSAGINTRVGFYGALSYKYHFLVLPVRESAGVTTWHMPRYRPVVASYQCYAGVEARTSFNRNYLSFAETNMHLGMCYESYKPKFFEYSIYMHGGCAKDLLNRINTDFYPFAQLGVIFSI